MLPPNRQLKKLGNISKLQNGYAFKSGDYVKFSDTLNFRMSNIRPGGGLDLDHNKKYLPDHYAQEYSNFLLNDGDIVIAMTDMATDPKILAIPTTIRADGRKLLLNQRVGRFYIQEDKLLPDYLKYLLLNPVIRNELVKKGGGGVQINLSSKDILNTEIPLPPLPVQHAIVDTLDHASAQITASRTAIQSQLDALDQLWQSTLSEVFGKIEAKEVNLGDTVKIIGGGTPSKNNKLYYEKGTIPRASVRDMKEDEIKTTELSITEEGLKSSSSNIVSKDGIIIATRVGLGKVCYINQNTAINQDLKGLIPQQGLKKEFLFWFMKSIANIIIAKGTGATVQGVKLDFIKEIQIPLPDLATQTSIVSHLDDVSHTISLLKTQYLTQLQSYDDLWTSILDQAFRGELVSK